MNPTSLELQAFLHESRRPLLRYLTRLVGSADAQDVAQIALANAAAAFSTFRGEASVRTWLYRIATNAAHDWRRTHRHASERNDMLEEARDNVRTVEPPSQERTVARQQMSACVSSYLSRLPEGYQAVLALSDVAELSDREIASILGVTVGAAKIRLNRARTRLREELERACTFHRDDQNVFCCEPKEPQAHGAYPFEHGSRRQHRLDAEPRPTDPLNKETTMTSEALSPMQKHLLGVAAAVAAGCQPCTLSFSGAARKEGADARDLQMAADRGHASRARADTAMATFTADKLPQTADGTEAAVEDGSLLALLEFAAAIAGNHASLVASTVERARAHGASDGLLLAAAEVARVAKRGAERATEAALSAALGASSAIASGIDTTSCASVRSESPTACSCNEPAKADFETVQIETVRAACTPCEDYARQHASKPIVVMSCEGACLRGEISRIAANHLCHVLAADKTARLCLGGAFTKDAGQRALAQGAERLVALEGCALRCASRMMRPHRRDIEVLITDGLVDFDRSLFALDALAPEHVQQLGQHAATAVAATLLR